GVAVVARRAVRLRWIRADAQLRVAGARSVALIGGRTHDRVRAGTRTALARVALRAGIAVAARGTIGLRGARTNARLRIAGARGVALVGGGADDGAGTEAHARHAGVDLGAGVAVVARGAIRLRGIRADAR